VNRRAVFFTATAQRHVERERAWWLANRDHTEIFADELGRAVDLVRVLPGAGTPYELAAVDGLRRVYLERIGAHLYYTADPERVVIRALWGARRRRGPRMSR
jgi:hypothetical protein